MRYFWIGICYSVLAACFYVHAQEISTDRVSAKVVRENDRFLLTAQYFAPLTPCQAYQYLIDFESAKNIPGVVDSKVIRREGKKVQVERWAEEKILLLTIRLHSVIEYTEIPYQGTEFNQLHGDAKEFRGKWWIVPQSDGVTIQYSGVMEPDSSLPMFILQYFIRHSLEDRFRTMAKLAAQRKELTVGACQ